MSKHFPAKILLFGEYTILFGSPAIAVPIRNFTSKWEYSDAPHPSHVHLQNLLQYLKKEQCSFIDLRAFEKEMQKGLLFDTTIPIGYGAGSSGSVSAAVLKKFGLTQSDNLLKVRKELRYIENHFHGNSSGLDPLVSYFAKPVLINEEKEVHLLDKMDWAADCTFFLIDTLRSRSTAPLVVAFKESIQDEAYLAELKSVLVPDVSKAIENLQAKKWGDLFDSMHDISMFQFKHFKSMIMPNFHDLWFEGLTSDLFKLKLCGAGGGGFILGMAPDYIAAKKEMRGYKLSKIII